MKFGKNLNNLKGSGLKMCKEAQNNYILECSIYT